MSPEEFERLKAEEKAHLRKLRDLKQTYRGLQSKKSTADALNEIQNSDVADETDRLTQEMLRESAQQEARLELALEGQAPQTGNVEDLDRDDLAKAEAEALVKQMKAAMGGALPDEPTPNLAIDPARNPDSPFVTDPNESHGQRPAHPAGPTGEPIPPDDAGRGGADKTIGRAPLAGDPPPTDRDGKTIGRSKS
ncbi:hypothetical protein RQM47_00715 [Rubrivirga sp. S365]|uniref:Uncharacterized protein n=1 Tax=Rubrivirga litoralis TaxID=3075598 RepID=A0ABU3BU85_9BACT|nr:MULTISPECIES: hypothetical protein [unclassified Rubrivirga]MDT0632853.1 hypothetical protein [Rubrivirga sp. F394]MDT7855157.1 hypothetical protein [Rubrivirga sp. S365]